MAKAATYQCPNCNGVLSYDAGKDVLACAHCGSVFAEGEVDRAIPLGNGDAAGGVDHVLTVEEFLEHAPWEADGTNADNAIGYTCQSCGANVVADRSAVTASCPYCGNNMLVSGIATAGNIPQKVIPFSVTRDDAVACMRKHFRRKWYLSRKFDAQVEHLLGVYVPYHLYGLRVSGWADYLGNREAPTGKGDHIDMSHIALHREGCADITLLPVDGSSKMPDAHMDAIAPFDFGKMRDFSAGYLAGYLAEVPDETAEACLPRADKRVRDDFAKQLADDARKGKGIDNIETIAHQTDVQVVRATTCALPVWLMHCSWQDNQMLFAVNGESGKCVGDLPIDNARRGVTLAIAIALAIAIVWPLIVEMTTSDDMPGSMILIAIAILGIPFFVDMFFKSQMQTAVEAEGDGLDFSTEGLVITDSWDGPKFHLSRKKALADFDKRQGGCGRVDVDDGSE